MQTALQGSGSYGAAAQGSYVAAQHREVHSREILHRRGVREVWAKPKVRGEN